MQSFRGRSPLIVKFLKSLILLLWMTMNMTGISVCYLMVGEK